MAFWKNRSKTRPEEDVIVEKLVKEKAAEVKATIEALKEPPPDLSTKPKDIVGYCFGYACPKSTSTRRLKALRLTGTKNDGLAKCAGQLQNQRS